MIAGVSMKFGGVMPSNTEKITIWNGHVWPILHVPWNFEIFHDRLEPDLMDDVSALTL